MGINWTMSKIINTLPSREEKKSQLSPSDPHVGVMFTTNCNMSCRLCLNKRRSFPDDFIKEETIHKIIIKLKKINFNGKVAITGGEPSLHPNFLEYCKIMANSGLNVYLATNFTWVDYKKPLNHQRKFKFIENLIYTHKNFTLKIPMDSLHFSNNPKLPKIIKKFQEYIDSGETFLKHGVHFSYCRVEPNLNSLIKCANLCNFKITEENIETVLQEWRTLYDPDKMEGIINFLEIDPQGNLFLNCYEYNQNRPLGRIEILDKVIKKIRKDLKSGRGKRIERPIKNMNLYELKKKVWQLINKC